MKNNDNQLRNYLHYTVEGGIFSYAAQLSYALILAFLPMLMIFNYILTFFSLYIEIPENLVTILQTYLPDFLVSIIAPALSDPVISAPTGLHSLTSTLALSFFIVYASIRMMKAFMEISTSVSGQVEDRSFVKRLLLATRDLFVLIASLLLIFFLYFAMSYAIRNLAGNYVFVFVRGLITSVYSNLILVYAAIFGFFLLTWLYSVSPAKHLKYYKAFPGAALTYLLWGLLGFAYNLGKDFTADYSSLNPFDSGINLMVLIYFISVSMLLGVMLNSFLEGGARALYDSPESGTT